MLFTIIVLPTLCNAEPLTIKNWYVEFSDKDSIYAATFNDTGSAFGQFCFQSNQSCIYLIGLNTSCEIGSKYPVLINTDVGTSVQEIYCDGQLEKGSYRYAFTDFSEIDELIKTASRIGFALPLKGDQFKVIRFSLEGAATAIKYMRSIVDKTENEDTKASEQIL